MVVAHRNTGRALLVGSQATAIDLSDLTPEKFMAFRQQAERDGRTINHDDMAQCIEVLLNNFFERQDAYEPVTILQLKSNWKKFYLWCKKNSRTSLPADRDTVEEFLKAHKQFHRNSLYGYTWAISKVHQVCGLENTTKHIYTRATLKSIVNVKRRVDQEAVNQATPFRSRDLAAIKSLWLSEKSTTKQLRDVALLMVAHQTLLRESELARIQIGHIQVQPDGSGILEIPWTKTNKRGVSEYAYLSSAAITVIELFLQKTRRELCSDNNRRWCDSYLFIPCQRGGRPSRQHMQGQTKLSRQSIDAVFKEAFRALNRKGKCFSGHSARVGAAQDLSEAGYNELQIQHAGRWTSNAMPYQYSHGQDVRKGAMAQFLNDQADE